ncbi:TPA: hypothetical protein U1D07_002009 [Streptococcus suis]|nr:hypothetical protein [Streptococcus suis]
MIPIGQTQSVTKGSLSLRMKLYQEQFKELSALVITYASLLETDIALISQTGQELVHTDNVLGHTLFSGLN